MHGTRRLLHRRVGPRSEFLAIPPSPTHSTTQMAAPRASDWLTLVIGHKLNVWRGDLATTTCEELSAAMRGVDGVRPHVPAGCLDESVHRAAAGTSSPAPPCSRTWRPTLIVPCADSLASCGVQCGDTVVLFVSADREAMRTALPDGGFLNVSFGSGRAEEIDTGLINHCTVVVDVASGKPLVIAMRPLRKEADMLALSASPVHKTRWVARLCLSLFRSTVAEASHFPPEGLMNSVYRRAKAATYAVARCGVPRGRPDAALAAVALMGCLATPHCAAFMSRHQRKYCGKGDSAWSIADNLRAAMDGLAEELRTALHPTEPLAEPAFARADLEGVQALWSALIRVGFQPLVGLRAAITREGETGPVSLSAPRDGASKVLACLVDAVPAAAASNGKGGSAAGGPSHESGSSLRGRMMADLLSMLERHGDTVDSE